MALDYEVSKSVTQPRGTHEWIFVQNDASRSDFFRRLPHHWKEHALRSVGVSRRSSLCPNWTMSSKKRLGRMREGDGCWWQDAGA